MTEGAEKPAEPKPAAMKWADFLVSHAPNGPEVLVSQAIVATPSGRDASGPIHYAFKPNDALLPLQCTIRACDGVRHFERQTLDKAGIIGNRYCYSLSYTCRNCKLGRKLYVVLLKPLRAPGAPPSGDAVAVKLGEWPVPDERLPNRAIRLIEPDKQLFFQGRKAENRGLGIGALAYYRRVLDNQRARIIGEILKAATRLGAKPDQISQLEAARTAWRFTDSVDEIKAAIPDSLLILGQNPLLLLHDAMSEGIHGLSDAQCLARASGIRQVLAELAVRVDEALRDQAELHDAVKELINTRARASQVPEQPSTTTEPPVPTEPERGA